MKIGVSSYSFSQYMNRGLLTQLSAVAKAKELGFDAIEFTDLTPPQGVTQAAYAAEIRAEAQKQGIEIAIWLFRRTSTAGPGVTYENGCRDQRT